MIHQRDAVTDPTLDKAKRLIHKRDAVKEQQETLKAPIKEENFIDAVNRRTHRRILSQILSTPPPLYYFKVAEGVARVAILDNPTQLEM